MLGKQTHQIDIYIFGTGFSDLGFSCNSLSQFLFPYLVQTIRFAVELKYLGAKKKVVKLKRATTINEPNAQKEIRLNSVESEEATFAIIRICLYAPLGETYNELKVFRDTFVSQNRLLHCNLHPPEPSKINLSEIQRENYIRFDAFIRETMRYIVDKNVHSVEEKRGNFCCVLQNLTNVLLKVVGSDFNMRTRTTTNAEFTVSNVFITYKYSFLISCLFFRIYALLPSMNWNRVFTKFWIRSRRRV